MALTISNFQNGVAGNKRRNIADITFDSSYNSGGESLTPAALGLVAVDIVHAKSVGGYVFSYDRANQKLLAYQQTDPAAVGGANVPLVEASGDLSTVTTRVEAVGI